MFFTVSVSTKSIMGPFFLEKQRFGSGKMKCEVECSGDMALTEISAVTRFLVRKIHRNSFLTIIL